MGSFLQIETGQYAEIGVWCCLPAGLSSEPIFPKKPQIHVHLRTHPEGAKKMDANFSHVSILDESRWEIDANDAVALLRGKQIGQNDFVIPKRKLNLDDFDGCRYWMWASTPALFWKADRPQEHGIHVHICRNGRRIVDETFGEVTARGNRLDRTQLFQAMSERTLSNSYR